MYLNGLCFITDRSLCRLSVEDMVSAVLRENIKWIQYREKETDPKNPADRKKIYETGLNLRKLTQEFNAAFIVNDYADIALAVNADGVHLGQDDLPIAEARKILGAKKIIGISTHSIQQALEAEKGGADYIGFGPIFNTQTKDAGKPKGAAALKEIKKHIKIPVVAIGGINTDNLKSVLDAGADAAAAASAILCGDIPSNIKRLKEILYSHQSIV